MAHKAGYTKNFNTPPQPQKPNRKNHDTENRTKTRKKHEELAQRKTRTRESALGPCDHLAAIHLLVDRAAFSRTSLQALLPVPTSRWEECGFRPDVDLSLSLSLPHPFPAFLGVPRTVA